MHPRSHDRRPHNHTRMWLWTQPMSPHPSYAYAHQHHAPLFTLCQRPRPHATYARHAPMYPLAYAPTHTLRTDLGIYKKSNEDLRRVLSNYGDFEAAFAQGGIFASPCFQEMLLETQPKVFEPCLLPTTWTAKWTFPPPCSSNTSRFVEGLQNL